MAGMSIEKVVLDYCLKLPKGSKEYCQDDAATYAALTCPRDVSASKCEFSKKPPKDEQAAAAWKNLKLVIEGKQPYELPPEPPAAPAPAAKPKAASKPAAPASKPPAPQQKATPTPSRPKAPTAKAMK